MFSSWAINKRKFDFEDFVLVGHAGDVEVRWEMSLKYFAMSMETRSIFSQKKNERIHSIKVEALVPIRFPSPLKSESLWIDKNSVAIQFHSQSLPMKASKLKSTHKWRSFHIKSLFLPISSQTNSAPAFSSAFAFEAPESAHKKVIKRSTYIEVRTNFVHNRLERDLLELTDGLDDNFAVFPLNVTDVGSRSGIHDWSKRPQTEM